MVRFRWSRQLWFVVAVVVGLLVTGCGLIGRVGGQAEPKASDSALRGDSDLADGCARHRTSFARADPYAGDGPHPIVVFRTDETGHIEPVSTFRWDVNRPRQWMGVDAERYQLIVCLGSADDGERLGQCDFRGSDISLYRGRYDATVYEARTGAKVGSARMRGSGDTGACPGAALVPTHDPKLHTDPDLAEFQRVLGGHVDRALAGASPTSVVTDVGGLCRALAAQLPEADRIGPIVSSTENSGEQSCMWHSDTRFVTVDVRAAGSFGSAGAQATDNARIHYHTATTMMADPKYGAGIEDVPGLGDQAAVAQSTQYSHRGATVAALIRNVTVEITWTGRDLSYPDAKDHVIAAARKAIELAVK